MPQPNRRRLVSCAITARIAVDERASNECLRHHGYASAIQKASNPASSQAFAMATVSRTGSMLSCRTPTLNGIVISLLFGFAFGFPALVVPTAVENWTASALRVRSEERRVGKEWRAGWVRHG